MRIPSRAIASALGLTLTLTACGGGHSSSLLPATTSGGGDGTDAIARAAASTDFSSRDAVSTTPMISVPRMYGALAFTDAGRRAGTAPVAVSLTLRYNNQAELDKLVDDVSNPHSGSYRQFLTPEQFNTRYAPTAQQEESVVQTLQREGFTVTQRFSNRTVVDATAPSSTVERFFGTEMHTVQQGKYGTRFTNVKAATVPSTISALVRTASLSNLVMVRTVVDQTGGPIKSKHIDLSEKVVLGAKPSVQGALRKRNVTTDAACTGQLLGNPGFESGNTVWSTSSDVITDDSSDAYAGDYFAFLDGYTSAETDTLKQAVAIPAGCTATLTYELYVGTNERSTSGAIDTLALTVNGTTEQSFSNKTTTGGGYVAETVNLSSFAGTTATILWTSKQTGSKETAFFIDSTALTLSGGTATPSPTPVPTATPTAEADGDTDPDGQADGDADGCDSNPDSEADGHADDGPDGNADDRSDRNAYADCGSHRRQHV